VIDDYHIETHRLSAADLRAAEQAGLILPADVARWIREAPEGTTRSVNFDPDRKRWQRHQRWIPDPPPAVAA